MQLILFSFLIAELASKGATLDPAVPEGSLSLLDPGAQVVWFPNNLHGVHSHESPNGTPQKTSLASLDLRAEQGFSISLLWVTKRWILSSAKQL